MTRRKLTPEEKYSILQEAIREGDLIDWHSFSIFYDAKQPI